MKLIAIIVCSFFCLPGWASAADRVKSCPGLEGKETKAIGSIGDVSVRNMTCDRARVALQTTAYLDRRGKMRVYGYACSQIGTYGDGGIFRCTKGKTAVRFSAGG